MSENEVTTNSNAEVKTPADKAAVDTYIQDKLVNGTLVMKDAVSELNWSFPRIRSKAKTIAKKLDGTLVKKARGEYSFQPNPTKTA